MESLLDILRKPLQGVLPLWRRERCHLVYHNDMLSAVKSRNSRQSFDIGKFRKIRDRLIQEKLINPRRVLKPEMVSDEDLLLVHTRGYLNKLKNPVYVAHILLLDYVDPWDNYVFEYFKYVTGGTLLAARQAMQYKAVAFNLGGGFHHAFADHGGGYCLINDVAVAIAKFHQTAPDLRFLVVDLDLHQGDGLLHIFRHDERVFHFDIHAESWITVRKKNQKNIALPPGTEDGPYLDALQKSLPPVFESFDPHAVFYLAGSDPYQKDLLGNFQLTQKGLLARDQFVYQEARHRGLPLVVVAAGGYGPHSWRIYYNFLRWALGEAACR